MEMRDLVERAQATVDAAAREEWLSVKEYARAKGVTTRTVMRWLQRDLVVAERTGRRGRWRIRPEPRAA
jgi:hypothetical protein